MILRDIFKYFRQRKKYWLLPTILILLILGFLIVLGGSSLGPYIYTLF